MKQLLELPEFPITNMPPFDKLAWRLTVDGLVSNPLKLSYDEVLKLPHVSEKSSFACVDGWKVADNHWKGIAIKTLLDKAGLSPEARYVVFFAGGFFISLSLSTVSGPQAILAYSLNGETLTPEHGYPLRLVVPDRQCYYGVKWVHCLEVVRRAKQSGKTLALERLRRGRTEMV